MEDLELLEPITPGEILYRRIYETIENKRQSDGPRY